MSISKRRRAAISICLAGVAGALLVVAIVTATTGRTTAPPPGSTSAGSGPGGANVVPSPTPTTTVVYIAASGPDGWTVISSLGVVVAAVAAVGAWVLPRRPAAAPARAAPADGGERDGQ